MMRKEYSAGAVIFRREGREGAVSTYLMLYSGRNSAWGFAKGHIEPGESEKEAALREIKEETGIEDLIFIDGFRAEDIYRARSSKGIQSGDVEKHSIYYLCETEEKDMIVDGEEITDYKWLPVLDAEKLLTFDSLNQILRKAEAFTHMDIPQQAKWKKVAINHRLDRYVLDLSNYKLPYYEVKWIDCAGDDHEVYFVVPEAHSGLWWTKKELIDRCNKYAFGPYFNHIKAIKEDSKKRGLPTELAENADGY